MRWRYKNIIIGFIIATVLWFVIYAVTDYKPITALYEKIGNTNDLSVNNNVNGQISQKSLFPISSNTQTYSSIYDLRLNPASYDGKTVKIKGKATVSYYQSTLYIQDSDGYHILVVDTMAGRTYDYYDPSENNEGSMYEVTGILRNKEYIQYYGSNFIPYIEATTPVKKI